MTADKQRQRQRRKLLRRPGLHKPNRQQAKLFKILMLRVDGRSPITDPSDIAADREAIRRLSDDVLTISACRVALVILTKKDREHLIDAGLVLRQLAGLSMPWDD